MNLYPFIEAEKAEQRNVKRACELLEVSRAAYYQQAKAQPSQREMRDDELIELIIEIHDESKGTYGAPRVHAALRKRGVHCGKKRVARLMVKANLIGRCARSWRKTTIRDPHATPITVDAIGRDFTPGPINTRWCGDITYIPTWEGWLYLATVIDIGSRRVVGWAIADHLRTELVASALEMAYNQRRPGPGVIFHSDQGCQYTSGEFAALAERLGISLSLGQKGQCWDNALAESFFATLKAELVERYIWPTRAGARAAIFEFVESWYNLRRLHSSLGYMSPAEYEASVLTQAASAA